MKTPEATTSAPAENGAVIRLFSSSEPLTCPQDAPASRPRHRATGMPEEELDALLKEVARGTVGPRTALSLITLKGETSHVAARLIFYALGGSDETHIDREGRVRYSGSGKLVCEVEQLIAAAVV